ncbi:sigma-70 family RNA polymerase sigma factor [Streptomyces sp. NPDC005813]|uniref:sigma-70 family RNA polymerase sigma factor n=1 Tax=Streptomyces sp. NPDC005813 TaxID=3155592 RepID=UPI0033F5987C
MSTSRCGSRRASSQASSPEVFQLAPTPEAFVRKSLRDLRHRAVQWAQGPNMVGWDWEGEVNEAIAKTVARYETLTNPGAYAAMILRNSAKDHLRRVNRLKEVPVGGTADQEDFLVQVANGATAGEHLHRLSFTETTKAVLKQLSSRDREILVLHAYDFSTREIGGRLGLKVPTVRAARRRAFKAYRRAHEQLFPGHPSPAFPTDTAEVL